MHLIMRQQRHSSILEGADLFQSTGQSRDKVDGGSGADTIETGGGDDTLTGDKDDNLPTLFVLTAL